MKAVKGMLSSSISTCQYPAFRSRHVKIFAPPAEEGGQPVIRPYTPVSPITEKGSVTFVIKLYRKCEEFPDGGKMSAYLDTVEVGDKVTMEGPIGKIIYTGEGNFVKMKKPLNKVSKIGLLAGGSGITPVYAIMNAMRLAKETDIEVKCLYSNKSAGDILIKDELDVIEKECPNIKIYHTLTREKVDGMLNGRVSMEMLKELDFPEAGPDTLMFSCGPKAFNDHIKEFLTEAGYEKDLIYP